MSFVKKIAFASLLCSMPLCLYAGSTKPTPSVESESSLPSKSMMLSDLDFIRTIFKSHYAPGNWKQKYLDWDLDDEINIAKQEVLATPTLTLKGYQRIVKKLFESTQDFHVRVRFHSTEFASLPFQIKGAQGRYFIVYVDRSRLFQPMYPIEAGDEVISIDGKPIANVVSELRQAECGPGNEATNQALAEILLTYRTGRNGHVVPHTPVMVKVKHKATGTIKSYQLIWDYSPEKIASLPVINASHIAKLPYQATQKTPLINSEIFNKQMLSPVVELKDISRNESEENRYNIGSRESYIPALGVKIWESIKESAFDAYIYENDKKQKIGYIRIPFYTADTFEAMEFAVLIKMMNEQTDALVIDEINNPGGSVFYLYSLASMLTQQPLMTPRHRVTLNQADIEGALTAMAQLESVKSDEEAQSVLGASFGGCPVTHQFSLFILNYFRFMLDQWSQGKTMTDPTYLYGIDYINPFPLTSYSKPILIVVNELCFSGGDFFPAILQDNKAATIFGTRTAGAGGYVDTQVYKNMLGISDLRFTGSIAERADKNPIENLGVTPDITYELTADDLQYGYHGYVNAINDAVKQLLK